MIAVLFNSAGTRLGEVTMPDDCQIIQFGGAHFCGSDRPCKTDNGLYDGYTFEQAQIYVKDKLDTFNPR